MKQGQNDFNFQCCIMHAAHTNCSGSKEMNRYPFVVQELAYYPHSMGPVCIHEGVCPRFTFSVCETVRYHDSAKIALTSIL